MDGWMSGAVVARSRRGSCSARRPRVGSLGNAPPEPAVTCAWMIFAVRSLRMGDDFCCGDAAHG